MIEEVIKKGILEEHPSSLTLYTLDKVHSSRRVEHLGTCHSWKLLSVCQRESSVAPRASEPPVELWFSRLYHS